VEAILQAMQVYALNQGIGREFRSPHFEQVTNHKIVWKYRGQIIQANKKMYLDVHFKEIKRRGDQIVLIGDASLWRDNMRIYQVTDIAIGVSDAAK
jgi:hypothetical protein